MVAAGAAYFAASLPRESDQQILDVVFAGKCAITFTLCAISRVAQLPSCDWFPSTEGIARI